MIAVGEWVAVGQWARRADGLVAQVLEFDDLRGVGGAVRIDPGHPSDREWYSRGGSRTEIEPWVPREGERVTGVVSGTVTKDAPDRPGIDVCVRGVGGFVSRVAVSALSPVLDSTGRPVRERGIGYPDGTFLGVVDASAFRAACGAAPAAAAHEAVRRDQLGEWRPVDWTPLGLSAAFVTRHYRPASPIAQRHAGHCPTCHRATRERGETRVHWWACGCLVEIEGVEAAHGEGDAMRDVFVWGGSTYGSGWTLDEAMADWRASLAPTQAFADAGIGLVDNAPTERAARARRAEQKQAAVTQALATEEAIAWAESTEALPRDPLAGAVAAFKGCALNQARFASGGSGPPPEIDLEVARTGKRKDGPRG